MKAVISVDNTVVEQLLAYTQAKTAKESIILAIDEYIRFKQRQELPKCRSSVDIEDNGLHNAIWNAPHETGVNWYLCANFANDSVKINIEKIFKLISPTTEIKTL